MRNTSAIMKSTTSDELNWNTINWFHINRYVETMQQRIYRAEILGNKRKVRDLQRILVHSNAMLLAAIKRVTQVNRGKRTPGIDGMIIKTAAERWQLYKQMNKMRLEQHQPKPSYRTYIKKKNGKLRPLSIPTIRDRVYQYIIKSALEPQWEARFEPCSYGFRPERGCHDAIQRIVMSTQKGGKRWIFEGDFKGCFDNLNHEYILSNIGDFPYRNPIKKWLKAGYVDNGVFNETETGSGQGNIVSPLLANIALMGMEETLGIRYRAQNKNGKYAGHTNETAYSLSFYADDFVVVCKTREDAEAIYDKLKPYLTARGLELSEEKTRIVNISEGFNFLGFNIRMFPTWYGEILLTRPSKETMKKSKEKIREIFKKCNGRKTDDLIRQLNPVITGLAGYWSPFNSLPERNRAVMEDIEKMGQIKVEKNVGGIEGLCVIEPAVHGDARGYFMETYNEKDMKEVGIDIHFVQDNQSMSTKGVLRGLHFQKEYQQCKLVRAVRGTVFDVAVDLRSNSKSYGKWYGVTLSAENKKQFLIPEGFAHGFLVLSDEAEFCYKVNDFWHPNDEGGMAWNDPEIGIEWPELKGEYKGSASADGYTLEDGTALKLSDKDQKWLGLKDTFKF